MIYTIGIDNSGYKQCGVEDVYSYFEDRSIPINLDTETEGELHSGRILSLQLGDADNQFFIDVRRVDILEFKELIENRLIVGQNLKYDYKWLKKNGIYLGKLHDLMLAESIIYCGYDKIGYGLDKLHERYLGKSLDKDVRREFNRFGDRGFEKRHIEYGCLDVTDLQEIREKQLLKINELELERVLELENEVVKAFGDMEYNGMEFNPIAWMEISHQTQIEAQNLIQELNAIVRADEKLAPKYVLKCVQGGLFGENGPDIIINYASPLQVGKICADLGYPTPSTDEKHLTRLKNKHKFFSKLIELRKKNKIISTYGESFLRCINPSTNRIHTSYWQIVETGRTSSGSKKDNAPNMQNIPRKGGFKSCFISKPGWSWVSSDYSGQEARLLASASQDKALMAILNSGKDIHCEVGTMMFEKPITKENEEERYLAKTVNFMVPYGSEAQKLADEMEISEEKAEELLSMHRKAFPELHTWLNERKKFAKKHEYSTTVGPIGRKRFYPDMTEAKRLRRIVRYGDRETWKKILIAEGQTERNGGNSPIQGAAADMSKEALIGIRHLISQYNYIHGEEVVLLLGMVHDSIECEARDDIAKEFAEEKATIMVEVANKYLDGVKMKVDTKIGKQWNVN